MTNGCGIYHYSKLTVLRKDDQLPNSPQDNHSLANLIKDLNINTGYTTRKITMEENIDKISDIVWLHVYVHTRTHTHTHILTGRRSCSSVGSSTR